jgi:Leucine-rich repeat (LRR) protein
MKLIVLSIFSMLIIGTTYSQITLIPDANFEQVLINNGIDSDGLVNGQMTTTDALGTTFFDASNANINDFTGIEAFVNLTGVDIFNNPITTLDLSQNVNLTYIDASNCQLSSFNFPTLTSMQEFYLDSNPFVSFQPSIYPAMKRLAIANSNISSLDLSLNSSLTHLYAVNTPITSVDLRNGNNASIISVICTSTLPGCFLVDDANAAYISSWNTGSLYVVNNELECNSSLSPVLIPDANFEQALIDLGFDTDNTINGQMGALDANTIANLTIPNKNINDLTGVESFANLSSLICNGNNLTALDLSNNSSLGNLNCSQNQLASLNLSGLSQLTQLQVNENSLTTLEVSQLTNLINLICNDNNLTALDLTNCTLLGSLQCQNNSIASLDLSNNSSLNACYAYANALTSINVNGLSQLQILEIANNQLASLDLSTCVALTTINAASNQISTPVDLSISTGLVLFNFYNNDLSSIDLRNGNNANITSAIVSDNPSLTCVFVDDASAIYLSTWNVGLGVLVNDDTECNALQDPLFIPDVNFEQSLIDQGYDTDNTINGQIKIIDALQVTQLDVNSLSISDLTGIEGFKNITILNCSMNEISSIDLSNNIDLISLNVSDNLLSSLDLSGLNQLVILYLWQNNITTIDLSNQNNLINLVASNNQLMALDLSTNTHLETVKFANNLLENIDLTLNPNLTEVDGSYNQLHYVDLRNGNNANLTVVNLDNNVDLTCIFVDDENAAYLTTWAVAPMAEFMNNESQCTYLGLNKLVNIISAYPNPVNDILTITVQKPTTFEIVSLDGKIIHSGSLIVGENLIDMMMIPTGIYILKTDSNSSIKVVKN